MIRIHHFLFLSWALAIPILVAAESLSPAGLIFHFDAERQPALRERASLPAIRNLQPVDLLLDASRNAKTATQLAPEQRPVFISDGSAAYLRFDGKNDFLELQTTEPPRDEITVILLIAPKENPGNFTGPVSMAALGQNDYTTGLNLDFGPQATDRLDVINVESAGATGFRDLLTPGFFNASSRPFGDFHVVTLRTRSGSSGTEVFLDGFKGGDRERGQAPIAMEQILIGARIYSNDGNQPPFAQGFFSGALGEILVYDRALADDERQRAERTLLEKAVTLNALLHGAKGHALETVEDPPLVQMFVPGFAVEELPIKIGNLNNVRYRHDGKLVGQGYNGHIYLLTDTDADGLEDKADIFWNKDTLRSPMGIALTGKDDPRGDGVFVASKGKISLIVDRDRDGRADEEIVIATGWPELLHGVDSLGLAVDPKDGSIYFGRGCANFADGYLIDKATGKSLYSLNDERGTIQRISPDFKEREIICTGVRFTCALAFNKHGDLFATDQEGATWLPNGNPLDELLHIQPGKHYGFPPRHPQHLPDVRDEPAVFEYGPQHQSTVGMIFNESVNGGPHFGPAHWQDNAIICGESRGKLYRTSLAKTPLGYVAQNHLIASVRMLVVDACVSPAGDLVLACHSGPPDWGTGPAGEGRLFKIRYAQKNVPQPVLAWAAAPDEFRIAFDRPLNPQDWANAQSQVKIEAGEHAGAGDRFEVLRPGYQVVRDQMAAPRRWVDVLGLTLTEDRRTLVLRVPRQTEPVSYAIILPLPAAWEVHGGMAQHPQIDLALSLNGIAAVVTHEGKELRTVLPHPSLDASKELTRGSAEHDIFLRAARSKGSSLSLNALVDVSNPFVPAVQPGSKLDWDPTQDPFASTEFSIQSDYAAELPPEVGSSESGSLRSVQIRATQDSSASGNGLFLEHDRLQHTLSTARVRVPWAAEKNPDKASLSIATTRSDVHGNWLRGRRLFFGEAGCATCHTVRDEGIPFGPDLSNLIFRDRQSVLQDIIRPSATINPDHTGSLVTLKDGQQHAGLVRELTDTKLVLALPAGAHLDLARSEVQQIEPLEGSLMPPGIDQQLSSDHLEDLLTFLLVEGLQPAPITRTDPPPPHARAANELIQVLGTLPKPPINPTPLNILLVAGPKDHGIDEHDYPLWLERWSRLLSLAENVTVATSTGFPTLEQLAKADVAVFYNANPEWNSEKASALDTFHKRGGGAVYLHYAVDGGKDPAGVAERVGLAFTLGSRFRHGEMDLMFEEAKHPIILGFPTTQFVDESYWKMRGDTSRLTVLGTSVEEGKKQPQLWTLERENSRIVGCIPGHYTWTFDDPLYRVLVLRAICWAAREENVDRLAELATVGARMAP